MNFGRRERHGAANVLNSNPCASEIIGPFEFGKYAERALLHHLRNELVRIEQLTPHRDKQRATLRLTRLVGDIGHCCTCVARQFALRHAFDVADRSLFFHSDCLTASFELAVARFVIIITPLDFRHPLR